MGERELDEAFGRMFAIPPEDFQLVGVRDRGVRRTELNERVHKFLGIFIAPSLGGAEDVYIGDNEMVALRNRMQREEGMPIKDVTHAVRWTVHKGDGEDEAKRFNFVAHLSASSILEFEVINGMFFILAECFGSFY